MTCLCAKFPVQIFSNTSRPQVAPKRARRDCRRNQQERFPANCTERKAPAGRAPQGPACVHLKRCRPEDGCPPAHVECPGRHHCAGLCSGRAKRRGRGEGLGWKIRKTGCAQGIRLGNNRKHGARADNHDIAHKPCWQALWYQYRSSGGPEEFQVHGQERPLRLASQTVDRSASRPDRYDIRCLALGATPVLDRPHSPGGRQ